MLRAISLRYQAQDSVRPGHSCDFAENLAAQAMADLAERGSLGVRELQSTFQLRLQDEVFGGQIIVPRQQFLVHRPRDVSRMRAVYGVVVDARNMLVNRRRRSSWGQTSGSGWETVSHWENRPLTRRTETVVPGCYIT